jgi:DNA-binding CsgD family transcriptional regulator
MGLEKAIPLSTFEQSDHAILVSDEFGLVRVCNRAAGALLGYDPVAAVGVPCWKVTRLQTLSGEPHCGRDCPIQRSLKDGTFEPSVHLKRPEGAGPALGVQVCTLPVPAAHNGRQAVIHIMTPDRQMQLIELENAAGALDLLSRREEEVLDLMASGLETREIAGRLAICPTTVRNHVQRILEKLSVHKRLSAVLIWMLGHRSPPARNRDASRKAHLHA